MESVYTVLHCAKSSKFTKVSCSLDRVPIEHIICCVMADRQCQVDEVELLQAMMSREGEFEWREDERRRTISGTLSVFLQLEQPISLKLVRKPKPSSVQREVKSKTTVSNWKGSSVTFLPYCAVVRL